MDLSKFDFSIVGVGICRRFDTSSNHATKHQWFSGSSRTFKVFTLVLSASYVCLLRYLLIHLLILNIFFKIFDFPGTVLLRGRKYYSHGHSGFRIFQKISPRSRISNGFRLDTFNGKPLEILGLEESQWFIKCPCTNSVWHAWWFILLTRSGFSSINLLIWRGLLQTCFFMFK